MTSWHDIWITEISALVAFMDRLQHRKSAKVLINEYERRVPSVGPVRSATGSLPLRRSLRNLLSLLKKGKSGLVGDKDKAVCPPTVPEVHELPSLPLPLGDAERPVLSRSQTQIGALVYLTPSSFDPGVPVWAPSTITLDDGKISVSWFTPGGAACAREISLLGCSNIRSVSDLRSLQAALPNNAREDLKVFELLFKDRRPTERFAATSVRERAKWISAFWDAILPSGEQANVQLDQLEPNSSSHPRPVTRRTNTTRSLPPIPIDRTLSHPTNQRPTVPPLSIPSRSVNTMARTSTNTLLLPSPPPKLPMPISPASAYSSASALPSPARSTPYSPRRWPSSNGGSSGASSLASVPSLVRRANSPSITNLSRLSVVKERLAQLERSASQSLALPASNSGSRSVRSTLGNHLDRHRIGDPSLGGNETATETQAQVRMEASFSSNTAEFNSSLKHVEETDGLPMGMASDHDHQEPLGPEKLRIMQGIASIQSVLGGSLSGSETSGPTIHQVALGLDHRLKGANETLKEVKSTLRSIEKRLEKPKSVPERVDPVSSGQNDEVLKVLQGVKAQLAADLPGLEAKISEIKRHQEKLTEHRVPASGTAPSVDLGQVQRQLDDLIKLSSSTQTIMKAGTISKGVLSEVTHLTSLMEGDRAHRAQQLLQQADSVRYLNELNTWLGAFVNNGASHIQDLAASIDKLCADLGSSTASNGGAPASQSLLNDVRQLVLGMKARDQNMASLQAAVNDLIVTIGSETRSSIDTQALADIVESQKRNQENMLKVFTDEISDEIKGERLRFVEAMKEATAINVQLHVEQLKKEMGKEVLVMAKEVERLHRDKQEVEQRIADLMAFYSKQTPIFAYETFGWPADIAAP